MVIISDEFRYPFRHGADFSICRADLCALRLPHHRYAYILQKRPPAGERFLLFLFDRRCWVDLPANEAIYNDILPSFMDNLIQQFGDRDTFVANVRLA